MAIRHIPARNTETGAEADIPETALQHLENWRPIDQADEPAAPASAAPDEEPAAGDGTAPTRTRTAAHAATTDKE